MMAGAALVRDWIARAARREPDKPWIFSAEDGRVITYDELSGLTRQLAGFLRARRIGRNDRVALLADNSVEHLACYLGVLAYGATICTIHVEMNRPYLADLLRALGPKLVVFDPDLGLDDVLTVTPAPCFPLAASDNRGDGFFAAVRRHEASDATAGAAATDDAVILFTSGTTARPKGVVLSFRELLSIAAPRWCWQKNFRAAGFSIMSGSTARRLRPAIRPPSACCSRTRRRPRCRACASSRRARRRSRSRIGNASRTGSASASRKAMAAARPAGSPRIRARAGGSARSASRSPITTCASSTAPDKSCRPGRSAPSTSAVSPTTTTATLATTGPCTSTAAGASGPAISASSTRTATSTSPAGRRN